MRDDAYASSGVPIAMRKRSEMPAHVTFAATPARVRARLYVARVHDYRLSLVCHILMPYVDADSEMGDTRQRQIIDAASSFFTYAASLSCASACRVSMPWLFFQYTLSCFHPGVCLT